MTDPTKPCISIAFEGTLTDGYLGGDLLNNPTIEGSMDALQELGKKYRLVIVTARSASRLAEVNDWIIRNRGSRHFTFEVANTRPAAIYYIEKRGIKFDSWNQVMSLLGS